MQVGKGWELGFKMWKRLRLIWDMAKLVGGGFKDGLPRRPLVAENSPANAGDIRDTGSIPGSGRPPWKRAGQPTPVFSPGESQGQRSLVHYSPWGCKESDAAEAS